MQEYPVTSFQDNYGQEISQRAQLLVDSLKGLWNRPHTTSQEELNRILDFVVHLPNPYRAAALMTIAENLVSSIGLHYLDILATFREKAEQEDIDAEEQEATLVDSMTELFPLLMGLSKRIVVQSLDDLATLSAITIGLYGLSHAETAEQAQRWIYSLPKVYMRQLAQEHMFAPQQTHFTVTVHAVAVPFAIGQSQLTFPFVSSASQPVVAHPHLTISIGSQPTRIVESNAPDPSTTLIA
jgi:hypothetical protein